MTVLADYFVLSDVKFSLATTTPVPFTFTLPANFIDTFPTPGPGDPPRHQPVLSFVLDTGNSTNLVFNITTTPNGGSTTTQFTATYNANVYHTVHEAINLNGLEAGVNEIAFARVSGTGTLEIGDVVLWYKRNLQATDLILTAE